MNETPFDEMPSEPTPGSAGPESTHSVAPTPSSPGVFNASTSSDQPEGHGQSGAESRATEGHADPNGSHDAPVSNAQGVAPLASQSRASKGLWSTRVSLLLVAALVGGLAGHFTSGSSNGPGGVTINEVTTKAGGAILPNGKTIPALVESVLPSVVSIDVVGQGQEDQGTGMIISKNGLVITNNHVIAAAVNGGTIKVTRSGSTKAIPATLIGTNPIDDVALIKINNASNLPAVTFGNSNTLVAGDAVVAIGNALGLAAGTPTVTSGIVSALGRTVTAGTTSSSETLNNMIQTDAAINPGNSGGPLLDSNGDVVGMNTAVAGTLPDGESAQNIGFAIPIATVQSLLKQLRAGESVVNHGAFIGVEIESMTPSLQAQYGFSVPYGAVVMSVISGTGAAAAGVKQGDVIVGINSTTVQSAQDVSSVMSALHPGDVIQLHVVRGTKHLTLKVTLGREPAH
ncbi:MAG TPA: trypsin-like peptidase domain-containing protein [Acidimicrobiales bacterium]|nr:trypsin-like peptidase domain-containing protein [Acidimicrobiales bacterium]